MRVRNIPTALSFALGCSLCAHAGSVDSRNNNSADFVRGLSRNASLDGGDIAIYNPAGTVKLNDGLLLSINNQTVAKFNQNQLQGFSTKYQSDIISPFYPTGFAVYKRGPWAAFAGFSFPGGGGELEYEKGTSTVFPIQTNLASRNPPLNADSYLRSLYYGGTFGAAYAINDLVSVSLAGRFIYARNDITVDAGVDLPPGNTSLVVDHMEEARGFTGILGVDLFPMPGLNVGLRIEGPTVLEFEVARSELNLDSVLTNEGNFRTRFIGSLRQTLRAPGTKFRRDLPANLGLGLGYAFLPAMRADFSFNYYLNSKADWEGKEDLHEDGWEASLALEYLWPHDLRTSMGGMYTVSGADADSYQTENPALDSYTVGLGGHYDMNSKVSLLAGFAGNFTFEDKVNLPALATSADLEKYVLIYALGIEYRVF